MSCGLSKQIRCHKSLCHAAGSTNGCVRFHHPHLAERYRGQLSLMSSCWVRRRDSLIAVRLASADDEEVVDPDCSSLASVSSSSRHSSRYTRCILLLSASLVQFPALDGDIPLAVERVSDAVKSWRSMFSVACGFPLSLFAGVTTRAE